MRQIGHLFLLVFLTEIAVASDNDEKYPLTHALKLRLVANKSDSEKFMVSSSSLKKKIFSEYACSFTISGFSEAFHLRSKLSAMLSDVIKKDPAGKEYYTLWKYDLDRKKFYNPMKDRYVKSDCVFEVIVSKYSIAGSVKKVAKKLLGKKTNKQKYARYQSIEKRLLSAKNKLAIAQNRRNKVAIDEASARVDQAIKGLQNQTANLQKAAQNRQNAVKARNEANQLARKNGYRVIEKGKNMNAEQQGISKYGGLNSATSPGAAGSAIIDYKAQGLLQYAPVARLSEAEVNIYKMGRKYYKEENYELEYSAPIQFQYDIVHKNPAHPVDKEKIVAKGKTTTKELKWRGEGALDSQYNEKVFPSETLVGLLSEELQSHFVQHRKNMMKHYESIYKTSEDMGLAQESGLALALLGGRFKTSLPRHKDAFHQSLKRIPASDVQLLIRDVMALSTSRKDGILSLKSPDLESSIALQKALEKHAINSRFSRKRTQKDAKVTVSYKPKVTTFISSTFLYPKSALDSGKEGSVKIKFVVADSNKAKDAEVISSDDPAFEEAVFGHFKTFIFEKKDVGKESVLEVKFELLD